MLVITHTLRIRENELEERFIRWSGPGGKNVNKVATAVQLRFNVVVSASLPEPVRARLLRLLGRRVSEDGVLTIEARRFRTRERNREDARKRLANLLRKAAEPPRARKPTVPTKAARGRRLEQKKRRGEIKRGRRSPPGGEM